MSHLRSPLRAFALASALGASLTLSATAQDSAPAATAPEAPTTVTFRASGQPSVTLTPDTLAAMPMRDQTISFASHGGETGQYRGVLLWDILTAHTDVERDIKTALRDIILVTARDGHQIAYSVGDIAPDFGNNPVMLAVERDGSAMDQGLRMVVPGDTRGARNIRDVTRIELR